MTQVTTLAGNSISLLFNFAHNRTPDKINIMYIHTKTTYKRLIEIHETLIRAGTSEVFAVIASLTSMYDAQYSGVYSNLVSSSVPLICAVKYFLPIRSAAIPTATSMSPNRLTPPRLPSLTRVTSHEYALTNMGTVTISLIDLLLR